MYLLLFMKFVCSIRVALWVRFSRFFNFLVFTPCIQTNTRNCNNNNKNSNRKMLLMTNIPSNFHAYICHSVLNFEVLTKLYTCFQGDTVVVVVEMIPLFRTLFQTRSIAATLTVPLNFSRALSLIHIFTCKSTHFSLRVRCIACKCVFTPRA